MTSTSVDDNDSRFTYKSTWVSGGLPEEFGETHHATDTPGAQVVFGPFSGMTERYQYREASPYLFIRNFHLGLRYYWGKPTDNSLLRRFRSTEPGCENSFRIDPPIPPIII